MASKRGRDAALLALGVFSAGAGASLAVASGLYACALVLGLAGAWAAAVLAGRALQVDWTLPAPVVRRRDPFQRRLLGAVLDQIPAPVLLLDEGAASAANRAARSLFGADDKILAPPPALLAALSEDPADRRRTLSMDVGGEVRVYTLSTLELTLGERPQRLALLVDIEPEIRTAEAAALREIMQVLSHEIMNALTPVASLAATALDVMADGRPGALEIAQDAVETLARRAEGLSRFVEAYRTLARLPAPVPKSTSVRELVLEAARLFQSRWPPTEVALELAVLDPDIAVALDLDLVLHALLNVLGNAADAATAGAEGPGRVRLTARARQDGVVFIVADNGPGVAPSDRERIFQPFFTTKATGTGVGLSFARQVALSHGGALSLAPSAVGEGATFELSL